jgi:acetate kinase
MRRDKRILTINSGSSSLKVALFCMGQSETRQLSGSIERIGLRDGRFQIRDGDDKILLEKHANFPSHATALAELLHWLRKRADGFDAVGHRIVHGGPCHTEPQRITAKLDKALAKLEPLDPDHLPQELQAIKSVRRFYPNLTQVVCFDTAFHCDKPQVAQVYPLPRKLWHDGVRRYGFHGLSYEFIVSELARVTDAENNDSRTVIAHLGNGASMAAIRGGKSIDTTMGFTPAGGLMMSTRSGDLDPGVMLYLLREKRVSSSRLSDLVNRRAGLLGTSGISSDMRDLLAREKKNSLAAETIALFCYQTKKFLGALTSVLGGLDELIFTAGIGENAPPIRWRICEDLDFLGIRLDSTRNDRNAAIISRDGSPVTVRVMKTNEEVMIARHTRDVIQKNGK